MTASNKILTVSYGTFSCTLEGFDNPFGTMQSIAEYFRDLAAEDRYFGAEPPTPDAQMLHQIAEREVRRRVEARVEDSGVVLRQMPDGGAAAAAPAALGASPVPSAPAPAAQPTEAPAQEAAASEAPAAEAAEHVPAESVTDKLSRIRAVVAKARAERERTYAEDEPVEDETDESLLSAFADAEDAELSDQAEDYETDAEVDDDSEPGVTASDALLRDDPDSDDDAAPETAEASEEETHAPVLPSVETGDHSVEPLPEADAVADETSVAETDEAEPAAPVADESTETAGGTVPTAAMLGAGAAGLAAATGLARSPSDRAEASAADTAAMEMESVPQDDAPEVEASTDARTEEAVAELDATDDQTAAEDDAAAADMDLVAESDAPEATDAQDDAVEDVGDEPTEAVEDEPSDTTEDETDDVALALAPDTEETTGGDETAASADPDAEDSDTDPGVDIMMREIAAALEVRAQSQADAEHDAADGDDATGDDLTAEADEEEDIVEVEMEDEDGTPRLVTMTRAEFEAALASGEIEEIDDEDDEFAADEEEDTRSETANIEEIRAFLGGTSLDESARDDLAAELAAIEAGDEPGPDESLTPEAAKAEEEQQAETAEHAAEAETAEDETAADETAQAEDDAAVAAETVSEDDAEEADAKDTPVAARDAADAETHGDLDRLIDEANAQMDAPEGNRRRSAIAHLKRAVAATKADDGLRDGAARGETALSKFREDLRQVVRPRRPETRDGDRSRRPENPLLRPAPLVLVSSQRVDADATPSEPVRPRRISTESARPDPAPEAATAPGAASKAQSFSDFAAERGATELPDLLEAAAAYAQIVEGQDSVSRPQMLRRASQATGEVSREEGLKSFGMLLRTGRIRKLATGKFSVADSRRTG